MNSIALHDADGGKFPNLALMKLSSWHKANGDSVEWFMPIKRDLYAAVYSSKVFSFTPDDNYLPANAKRGGTGYGLSGTLPEAVEHAMPDYSLYPDFHASLGFVTRGCPRSCPWCVVPAKEGCIRAHAELEEFLRPDSHEVVLMDNNILAHEHGIAQLEHSIGLGLRIDCNQGLDARLIARDAALARLLSRVRWSKSIRLACDQKSQMPDVETAVKTIRAAGGKKYNFSCYVLVKDVPDALERVEFLRNLDVDPFAQPYREPGEKDVPEKSLRDFARWVNHKAIFKTTPWAEYKKTSCKKYGNAHDQQVDLCS